MTTSSGGRSCGVSVSRGSQEDERWWIDQSPIGREEGLDPLDPAQRADEQDEWAVWQSAQDVAATVRRKIPLEAEARDDLQRGARSRLASHEITAHHHVHVLADAVQNRCLAPDQGAKPEDTGRRQPPARHAVVPAGARHALPGRGPGAQPVAAHERSVGAAVAIVASRDHERNLTTMQRTSAGVGKPACGVDQIRSEAIDEAAQLDHRHGIGKRRLIPAPRRTADQWNECSKLLEPAHSHPVVVLARRQAILPGGRHEHAGAPAARARARAATSGAGRRR